MTRFLFSVWKLRVSLCGAPSVTRGWVCNLLVQLLPGLARAVILGCKSRRTHDHILLSHMRLPQTGVPGPRIYIPPPPRNRVDQLHPLALGSLFVASYDSQSYGGGILTCLHTGLIRRLKFTLLRWANKFLGICVIWVELRGPLIKYYFVFHDCLCGLVVRVLGYRSGGPGSIPGTTKKSSGSGTRSTQPREYNWGATW
jgi:hypothetical protein